MLKSRLKSDAPSVLYGCGDVSALNSGGLAVVGSRHVDDELVQYTQSVGRLAAQSGKAIVSGGAKGIDQAAMHGAMDAGGRAVGVLADSLEKAVLARYNRDMLLSNQLTLASPYDPAAGFNVGNAMRRNKFVYALSDASLIVNSDLKKGGTWAGAVEQLDKLMLAPIYVRSTGPCSAALDALVGMGARPWPNPTDVSGFELVVERNGMASEAVQARLPFVDAAAEPGEVNVADRAARSPGLVTGPPEKASTPSNVVMWREPAAAIDSRLADKLFDAVRRAMRDLLGSPMEVQDIAAALQVSTSQAEAWLIRLIEEAVVEKSDNTWRYIATRGRVPPVAPPYSDTDLPSDG